MLERDWLRDLIAQNRKREEQEQQRQEAQRRREEAERQYRASQVERLRIVYERVCQPLEPVVERILTQINTELLSWQDRGHWNKYGPASDWEKDKLKEYYSRWSYRWGKRWTGGDNSYTSEVSECSLLLILGVSNSRSPYGPIRNDYTNGFSLKKNASKDVSLGQVTEQGLNNAFRTSITWLLSRRG